MPDCLAYLRLAERQRDPLTHPLIFPLGHPVSGSPRSVRLFATACDNPKTEAIRDILPSHPLHLLVPEPGYRLPPPPILALLPRRLGPPITPRQTTPLRLPKCRTRQ